MKQILHTVRGRGYTYEDKDGSIHHSDGDVMARVVLPEGEEFEVEPWMRHKIITEGWSVHRQDLPDSGLVDHGHANWREVADRLAAVTRRMLNEDPESEEDEAVLLADIEGALGDYDVAVMEVALGGSHVEEPEEEPDGDEA